MCMGIIRQSDISGAIYFLGDGPCPALEPSEKGTAPIGRVAKLSVTNILKAVVSQLFGSAL